MPDGRTSARGPILRHWRRLPLLFGVICVVSGCQLSTPLPQPDIQKQPTAEATGLFTDADGQTRRLAPATLTYTGEGSYRWPDGRYYRGSWRNGKPHGQGTGTAIDGSRYQGDWRNGKYHGNGVLQSDRATRYQGQFIDGMRAGQGRQQNVDGTYQGDWLDDLPHGEGTFTGADGSEYQGQYQQGNRHGSGRFASATGSLYEGDWINDEPSGFGVLIEVDGGRREGQWQAGRSEGYGTYEHPAGLRYSGHWRSDQRDGFGAEQRPDGSRYEGDWVTDQPGGKGTLRYSDGRIHSGLWQQGQPHGLGTLSHPAGYTLTGEWHHGRLPEGSLTLERAVTDKTFSGTLRADAQGRWSEAAARWLNKQADADGAAAAWLLAAAQPGGDDADRFERLQQAAAGNIAQAQYELGKRLLDEDIRSAVRWLNKAADSSLHNGLHCGGAAHFLLGSIYHFGELLPQDEDQAESHYLAAIERGSLNARRNLAVMLATTSISYLRDPERAVALLEPVATLYATPGLLDALAVVYHASGRFEDAVRSQRSALRLLDAESVAASEQASQDRIRAAMQQRLEQYQHSAAPAP